MDGVFSIDDMLEDMAENCWTSTTPLTPATGDSRASEWALERFLQEANSSLPDTSSSRSVFDSDTLDITDPWKNTNKEGTSRSPASSPAKVSESDDYQAILKSKLDLACPAVALTRAPYVINQTSPAAAESAPQGSSNSLPGSPSPYKGSQNRDAGASNGTPSSSVQRKPVAQAKQLSSCSSREQSDDDKAEGENVDPADRRRVRRMLSNREAARRSRNRNRERFTELETQVSQLRVENSSLLKLLTDTSQKYNEAAADNRVLKADVETLRAKVKMVEETARRVTGMMNSLLQAMSEITAMGMSAPFNGSLTDLAGAAVPAQPEDPKQPHFYHPVNSPLPAPGPGHRVDNSVADISSIDNVLQNAAPTSAVGPNKMGRTASLQGVASLEHRQKRVRGGVDQGSSHAGGEQ